jgi:hypothetical protein
MVLHYFISYSPIQQQCLHSCCLVKYSKRRLRSGDPGNGIREFPFPASLAPASSAMGELGNVIMHHECEFARELHWIDVANAAYGIQGINNAFLSDP